MDWIRARAGVESGCCAVRNGTGRDGTGRDGMAAERQPGHRCWAAAGWGQGPAAGLHRSHRSAVSTRRRTARGARRRASRHRPWAPWAGATAALAVGRTRHGARRPAVGAWVLGSRIKDPPHSDQGPSAVGPRAARAGRASCARVAWPRRGEGAGAPAAKPGRAGGTGTHGGGPRPVRRGEMTVWDAGRAGAGARLAVSRDTTSEMPVDTLGTA